MSDDMPDEIYAIDHNHKKIWEPIYETYAPFDDLEPPLINVTRYVKYSEYVKLYDKHYGTPCEQIRSQQALVDIARSWAKEQGISDQHLDGAIWFIGWAVSNGFLNNHKAYAALTNGENT